MKFQTFLNWGEIGKCDDIEKILDEKCVNAKIIKTNKKIEYFNIPCSFDIETSSFFQSTGNVEEQKQALAYAWALGLNGSVIIGRTWIEFIECVKKITECLKLWKSRRLIIYVHNLSFDFQFFRKYFEWEKIFAIDKRKPLYALTTGGIEFRCSYLLSGYSLAKIGENLQKYHVEKMVGDLDYKLIRHSKTVLTDKEIKYIENDVRVVMAYIQEKIEQDGDITKIPLTKTSYVRNYCRKKCMYDGGHKKNGKKYLEFRKILNTLTITAEEYKQLKRAFQGGFTHASAWYSGKIVNNVGSFDFTSSYPYVMVAEKFPMSKAENYTIKSKEDFEKNLNTYCCLFDVEIENIESVTTIEHPFSSSRCYKTVNSKIDNGRIISAKSLHTTLTELDYKILTKFYKWDNMKIYNFKRYKKGYLPTEFVKAILKLYADKTQLKDVDGEEVNYMGSKEMLNSCYGMAVTDICRSEIKYTDGEWLENSPDIEKALVKYNKSKTRFLFYPWGVWVTAYARYNLFTGISEFGEDYVYSDTDSVKGKNIYKHMEYINNYNKYVEIKLKKAIDFHGLEETIYKPKTIKGVEKILGVWDYEGTYEKFKTLGAKRYLTLKNDELNLTVSGLNKKACLPYLKEKYVTVDEIFKAFDNNLYIPKGKTGKNTHTYIDDKMTGVVTDYLGVTEKYEEESGIHLIECDYSLSLSNAYVDYVLGLETFEK